MFYSFGYNKYNVNLNKTITNDNNNTIHAEIDAVLKMPTNKHNHIKKVDALVFRISRNGENIMLGIPCNNCQCNIKKILHKKKYKLNRIYYTDSSGTIQHIV